MRRAWVAGLWLLAAGTFAWGQESKPADRGLAAELIGALSPRGIGPAVMSGRIGDIAVDPVKPSTWYVVAHSGGVFKTTNAGTTWTPIFDGTGVYSVGCVTIDPNDHLTIWVGSGENNSQRSVGYGDGLYKSVDGGKTFAKVGLERSEHIAKVLVDPRNSNVVYVAAQGPLWGSGGDRGLYKTTDGGKTWNAALTISENTGVTDVAFDPRNPDVIYAASYQRRRHVWTLIDGGPESGIYKSTDAGKTWKKINRGLPQGDKGRIGIAVSPQQPNVLYATVEAAQGESGFFRSEDAGETWTRRSNQIAGSPQYYQELFVDPNHFDRVYAVDTMLSVTEDGGLSFRAVGETWKHVDNHAVWIDPTDSDHLLVGCDGGLYQTWDRGKNYSYSANLPITQFYKIAVDNASPFYNVYGGTQDNATQGGPSRTTNVHGIRNSDWFVTVFGDGFDPVVDPKNPDIIYSQWQYGGLVRFDKKSGERIDIKPQEAKGGPALRWNWDSALILSPHSNTRLYFGSQILFRSDDRGDTWKAISPDLTRNIDRNQLKVMGRIWGPESVAKNDSTSFYGSIVALSESPKVEGLIYAGTDDGLIQVTEDGGKTWRKVDEFPFTNIPQNIYVSDIEASPVEPNTVYACLDHHQNGDFKPYVLKSVDRGKTWVPIQSNLPDKGTVYTIALDHEDANIVFVGTEFGVSITLDGGRTWNSLKGLPPIAVRDLEIQRRENDLVIGTFGRGIYIVDDYSPIRLAKSLKADAPANVLPIKTALLYIPSDPLAGGEKAYQGASFFTAPNPAYGATILYRLKDSPKTKKAARLEKDGRLARDAKDTPYPSWDEFKAEDREEGSSVFVVIKDEKGQVVKRSPAAGSKGIHRFTWDFRLPGTSPVSGGGRGRRGGGGDEGGSFDSFGPLALPGKYTVSIERQDEKGVTELAAATPFTVEALNLTTLPAADKAAVLAFARKTAELQRAALGTLSALNEAMGQVALIKRLAEQTPGLAPQVRKDARALELKLMDIQETFLGDPTRSRRNEPAVTGLVGRISTIIGGHWTTTSAPTSSHKASYDIAAAEFTDALAKLRPLLEKDLPALHDQLEKAGAPWAPGRKLPSWK